MYLAHFGLHEAPFGLTPDTAFAFDTRAHQEALNTLLVAVAGGEGFIKITGEVGAGKTLLCRRFLALLGGAAAAATGPAQGAGAWLTGYLPNPRLTPRELLLGVAAEIGLPMPLRATESRLHQAVGQRLLDLAGAGRRVLLCIDEAQAMTARGLETLRLLSNLETEKCKLLQLVLFGQPELDQMLALSTLRQLRQRIAFSYRLDGIAAAELPRYLAHRLGVAGCHAADGVFTAGAIAVLHRASGGTPRLINILAHKALLSAFGAGRRQVERQDVRAAAADTPAAVAPPAAWWRWLAS